MSCFSIDGSTVSLFIYDDILDGWSTISILPTLAASNGYKTITYTGQADFTVAVKSCFATEFYPLTLLTPQTSTLDISAFDLVLTDPAITFDFVISDSMSLDNDDYTFCGGRYATITADDSNPLTASLLECSLGSDCISLSTFDDYTFTLSADASNLALAA